MAAMIDTETDAGTRPVLDLASLDSPANAHQREPVAFLIAKHALPEGQRALLYHDFPHYDEAGFFDHDPTQCGPRINALVDELRSRTFAGRIGAKLGLPDLATKPMLVHLSFLQNRRHGTIHTDSSATLATVLLYFSATWPHGSSGCLRFLANGDDIESAIVPEIRPVYGTLVAFRRSDRSYHGYLPFAGERPVIKAAWLTNEAELARKTQRSRTTHFVKRVLGPIDRWFDAKRDNSKARRD